MTFLVRTFLVVTFLEAPFCVAAMQFNGKNESNGLSFQIHKITDVCWDICVDNVDSSLGRRKESCLSNCSDRFVDTTLFVTNRFAQLASKLGGGR